jgi:hypothetical protein
VGLDVYLKQMQLVPVYEAGITHNLNKMATEAGVYHALWRPEEIGITHAAQLIEPLTKALADLKARPGFYMLLTPENGWGTYEDLCKFIERYLTECIKNPTAEVHVDR